MSNEQSAQLSIVDLNDGMNYLAKLMLANPGTAERQLMDFLDALLTAPPDPGKIGRAHV